MNDEFDLGRTSYQRVRDVIRNDIVTGQFEAGARLKISELVARYGISGMPIREALHQLQGEGLIELSANRGASVRRISETFLWQIYEVRKSLEMHFVVELASHATVKEIDRMKAMLSEQKLALEAADEGLLQELDRAFHRAIVGATANEEALAILNRTYDLTRPLRLRFGRSAEQRNWIPRDHRAIVKALAKREGQQAAKLVSEHINRAFIDLANAMQLEDYTIRKRLAG